MPARSSPSPSQTGSPGQTAPRLLVPFTTDASGNITLTGLKAVSASTTTGTITATSTTGPMATTTVAVTPLTGAVATVATLAVQGGNYPIVPEDAVPIGADYFLTPDGRLFYGNTPVASGVTSAVGDWLSGGPHVSYIVGGLATVASGGVGSGDYPMVPADAVPVGADYFLTPGGELYYGNSFVTSGVTSATGDWLGGPHASFIKNGVAKVATLAAEGGDYPIVPADAVPVGADYFLTPGGELFYGNTFVTSGVTSAVGEWLGDGNPHASYIKNGVATVASLSVEGKDYPVGPADAIPVGADYFLTPGGELYYGETRVAIGVKSAIGDWLGGPHASYMLGETC